MSRTRSLDFLRWSYYLGTDEALHDAIYHPDMTLNLDEYFNPHVQGEGEDLAHEAWNEFDQIWRVSVFASSRWVVKQTYYSPLDSNAPAKLKEMFQIVLEESNLTRSDLIEIQKGTFHEAVMGVRMLKYGKETVETTSTRNQRPSIFGNEPSAQREIPRANMYGSYQIQPNSPAAKRSRRTSLAIGAVVNFAAAWNAAQAGELFPYQPSKRSHWELIGLVWFVLSVLSMFFCEPTCAGGKRPKSKDDSSKGKGSSSPSSSGKSKKQSGGGGGKSTKSGDNKSDEGNGGGSDGGSGGGGSDGGGDGGGSDGDGSGSGEDDNESQGEDDNESQGEDEDENEEQNEDEEEDGKGNAKGASTGVTSPVVKAGVKVKGKVSSRKGKAEERGPSEEENEKDKVKKRSGKKKSKSSSREKK